ncbi:MAG: Coenzyme F420 hydrogenase/dehydrogenase, beta subunit C-terminal domain [Prevotella sp.]|nr:Coenzyme F420 hydrogenase/dehydrogenase, beta subunit C-terminal domain [Prevotella sp.]
MIQIKDPADCCGCTACASICNHNAITMEPDALGFLYPKVDVSKCTDCGLCEKVCAFNDNYDKSLNLPRPYAYAARHNDMDEIMKSRSGAAFVAISDYILEQGGVVYGAGYKDHFRVAHKRATTKEERDEFRGSKYVQSDLIGVFRQVKQDLKNGLTVLFSGTPCQTSGLNSYIGKKLRENLILVDIVCHGVPGPFLWRDYIEFIEKKKGASITVVNFRDKEKYGWGAHHETFKFRGGIKP